jgi:hypothetical protein
MALCVSYFLARVSEDMGRIDLRPDYGNHIWRVHGVSPRDRGVARNQICCLTSPLPLIYKQNLISACPQPGPARQKITAQPADEAT